MPQCSFLLSNWRLLFFAFFLLLTAPPVTGSARPVARLLSPQAREQLATQLRAQVVPLLRRASSRSRYRLVSPEEQGLGLQVSPCLILTSSAWGALRGHEAQVEFFIRRALGPERKLLTLTSTPSLGLSALRAPSCRSLEPSVLERLPQLPRSSSIAARRYLLRSAQSPLEQLTLLGMAPHPFSFFDWAPATLPPGTPLFDERGRPVSLSARIHPGQPSHQLFIPVGALREFVRSLIAESPSGRSPTRGRAQSWWGRRLPERGR